MRRYLEHFLDLCKNRIFVMLCGVIVLFTIIVLRLFSLQIIHGEYYDESITASVSKTLPVAASRGNIYDRYGRPLAINTVAYCVQVDGSVTLELNREERKTLATDLTDWLWADGHHDVDSLPITTSSPYSFTFKGTDEEKEKLEKSWKASIGLEKKQYKLSATECLKYLYKKYDVPEGYTAAQKRTYLSLAMSDDRNLMALTLARKLSEFGETIDDELPLDTEAPYAFQFNGNTNREKSWKQSMLMKGKELNYNSRKTLDYLRDFFGLPEGLPEQLVRDTLGIRYSLYLKRYQQYQTVTIATDISDKTLAYVEENQDTFPNVVIDTVSLRDYPEGEYFSHILGYIRQMTESDYALYKDEVDADGNPLYSQTDVVGQDGMEKLYEKELNGVDGKVLIEVDNQGRRMSVIDSTEPVAGKDVFLTLDSKLQKVAYDTLESELRTAVLRKLTGGGKTYASSTELFTSMININHISAQKMIQAEDGVQKQVYQKLKQANPTFSPTQDDAVAVAKEFLIDGLEKGSISLKELMLMMIEQGNLSVTEEEKASIENGASPTAFIIKKLSNGEMSPADTGLDPCTGSVFVTQVGTGEVLASVTYPSYDNNELVNTFNNAYYNDLLQDGNTPLVNRPLKQKKASGSTFKMITALAGLETGTITPSTTIVDKGLFKDAGVPYARCWIYSNTGGTHGPVNVSHALEVSCNYFFYELGYRLGSTANGSDSNKAITTLNEYMAAFGLNDYTGVELDEYGPTMASPANKEKAVKTFNPDATTSQTRWTDGDTIRTAIGQSINSYTPAQITKYVSTLANGGTLYKLHMVDHIQNADGTLHSEVEETVENVTKFKEENLQAVYQGMYLVTNGSHGTLRTAFNDLPVKVAAKTGTAEEDKNRSSHTWFVCFAPFDDPQIAITVMIPFGEGSGTPAPAVAKAIIREYLGLDYTPTNTTMQTVLAE